MEIYIMLDENKEIRGIRQFSSDSLMDVPEVGWSFELVDETIANDWMANKETKIYYYIDEEVVIEDRPELDRKIIKQRRLNADYIRYINHKYPVSVCTDMLAIIKLVTPAKKALIDSVMEWKWEVLKYYRNRYNLIEIDVTITWNFGIFDSTDPNVDIKDVI